MYYVLYNDIAGKNTMSKCQLTNEFMIKVHELLFNVHSTTYYRINCNCPHVLVRFQTQGRFCASLSVRISDSGHPITYTSQFCRNKPGHKIYRYMAVRSTWHHTLLHRATIIHTKTFLRQPITPARYTDV